jgi:hypothetical protein
MELAALLPAATRVATMCRGGHRSCYHTTSVLLTSTIGFAASAIMLVLHQRRRIGFSGDGRGRRRSNAGVHRLG